MFIDFNGPAVPKEAYRYRDAGFLTKALVTAVCLSAALSIVALIVG